MRALWSEFRTFLGEHVLLWLVPMLVFFTLLAWLAWKQHQAPASPFVYEVF